MDKRKEKSNFVENIELLDSPLRKKNQTKSLELELDSYSGMFYMPVNYSQQSSGEQHESLTTLYQSRSYINARISSNIALNIRNHRKLKGAQHPTSIIGDNGLVLHSLNHRTLNVDLSASAPNVWVKKIE